MEHRLRIRAAQLEDTQQGVRFFVIPSTGVQKLEGASYAESFDDALNAAKRLSVQHGESYVILEVRFRATVGAAIGSPMRELARGAKNPADTPIAGGDDVKMFTGGPGNEIGVLPPGAAIEGEVLDP